MTTNSQLANYIRAGFPGLYLCSFEEQRVEAELIADAKTVGFRLCIWSLTGGLLEVLDANGDPPEGQQPIASDDPIALLDAFNAQPEKTIVIARDFHLFLQGDSNPLVLRKAKDALALAKKNNRVLIILGCRLCLPPELAKELTVIEFKLPDRAQLREVLAGIADSANIKVNGDTDPLLDAASGLTTIEAENAFALSVVEKKALVPDVIAREKAATVKKNGLLEIIEATTSLDDIGGQELRKEWLLKRRRAFTAEAREYGLPIPKGELAIGVPGCGKSLGARATAKVLGAQRLDLVPHQARERHDLAAELADQQVGRLCADLEPGIQRFAE